MRKIEEDIVMYERAITMFMKGAFQERCEKEQFHQTGTTVACIGDQQEAMSLASWLLYKFESERTGDGERRGRRAQNVVDEIPAKWV
jgi:hypothetical protein